MRVKRTIEPPFGVRSYTDGVAPCEARAARPDVGPGRTLASAHPALRLARHAAGPGIPALAFARVTPPRARIRLAARARLRGTHTPHADQAPRGSTAQECGPLVGKGGRYRYGFVQCRVLEVEARGVERDPLPEPPVRAVAQIADDDRAGCGQLHPDLVRTAGLGPDLNQRPTR